jgi:hypothetical protein
MRFDAALLAGNGEENLGDAVPDVVSYNVLYEEHRQPNADNRIDKVQPVGSFDDKLMRQQVLYLPDEPLQEQARASGKDADKEADEQHEVLVGQMPSPPSEQICYEIPIF